MVVELQAERTRRVFVSPLRAFVLVFCWVSSSTANNNASSNDTKTPNGSEPTPKPFSCEWKDLDFPITYGPGIASSLCVLIGGFHIILGEDKIKMCVSVHHTIRACRLISANAFFAAVFKRSLNQTPQSSRECIKR